MTRINQALRLALLALCVAAGVLTMRPAHAATITIQADPAHEIEIEGEIVASDPALLSATIKRFRHVYPDEILHAYAINSPGGDVEAAMQMGEILRADKESMITVATYQYCYSACVLVLAGSVKRNLHGQIGIHRLFVTSTDKQSYEQTRQQRSRLAERVKRYLGEMNVEVSLYDAMNRVPAEQLRILSREEYQELGLLDYDPVAEEMANAGLARRFGITRDEFNARWPRVNDICTKPPFVGDATRMGECVADVMHGVAVRPPHTEEPEPTAQEDVKLTARTPSAGDTPCGKWIQTNCKGQRDAQGREPPAAQEDVKLPGAGDTPCGKWIQTNPSSTLIF